MTSERIQRQIDRLLDEAEQALISRDWPRVQVLAEDVLRIDPENADGKTFAAAARRGPEEAPASTERIAAAPPQPTSFVAGRYQVKRFLGEGGKKKVYLAHDLTLDRDIAFALIKTEGLDDAGRERVTREAQAMARLGDHPNVVSVYDLGLENGQPYMVLPLLPGGDIEGLIEKAPEHRLPVERVLQIGVEVCQGLQFAHSKGIVHRDLKPGNVWLAEDGRAKIGDFGLAVAVDRSRLTQAGMMVGTVAYMPPEQAMGGEVTTRSDLYSLGCMLYEMVCGRPPFVGDDSVAIISQHLNTPPVAPSWHRPDCPPGLDTLILRLLEKDTSKRPASAAEVREALVAIAAGTTPLTAQELIASPHEHDPLYRRVFVGREQELRQLQAAFDSALSGEGSLAMVVGEPGIGKTALCEQLATYVAMRGGKALVGHSYEEGSLSLPYLPFVEAMRSYVLIREPDGLRSDLGSGASEVARIVSEVRDKVQVSPSETGDPDEQRWRLLQAVTGFLRNASAVQAMLIVLEDLHDADRGTLDLLLHLSRNLLGARLLIVGTYRDVEVDRNHPLSATLSELRRVGNFARVPLRGLTVDEVQRMMSNLRGQDTSSARAEQIHRQTEGNPLFVQEVLRYLVEEGIVVRLDGRYAAVNPDAYEASIPEGLHDVIGKRLSRLSEKANQVLSIAAIVGRDFRLDVLQKVAAMPEEEVDAALEEAVDRAVVEERASIGTLGFRFTHAFFRQTLYEETFASRRLRLHQQVARALEQVYGRRVDDHAAELAEHFAQSTDAADLEKALSYSELAAKRAMSVFAYGEAVRHLEQALKIQEVLDPDERLRRCDLLLALGTAMMPAGDPERAYREIAPEALALAEELPHRQRAARACWLALEALNRHLAMRSWRTPEYREWTERADRYCDLDTVERVWADIALADVCYASSRYSEAWPLYRKALDEARAMGDPVGIFYAGSRLVLTMNAPQHREEQARVAEEFASRAKEGAGRSLGTVLWLSSQIRLYEGDRELAEQLNQELAELAARTHDPPVVARAMHMDVIFLTIDGRLEAALEVGERLAGAGLLGPSRLRAFIYLGRYEEATSSLPTDVVQTHPILVLAYKGRFTEAEAALRDHLEKNRISAEIDETPTSALTLLLEVATLAGVRDVAALLSKRLFGQAATLTAAAGSAVVTCVGRHLGAASALLGQPEDARAYYGEALGVCEKVRFRPEIALTRLQLAELLLEYYPDERPAAIEHLDFAIGEFGEMKMQPSLERALRHRGLLKA